MIEIVALTAEHLDRIGFLDEEARQSYFSRGSVALCLLSDGVPVFAGGIVNLHWHRGEAWIIPTPFLRQHPKVCLKAMRNYLPKAARAYWFTRVQAVCVQGTSAKLFLHLGFEYEGTMRNFGKYGETCTMYSRIMGEA